MYVNNCGKWEPLSTAGGNCCSTTTLEGSFVIPHTLKMSTSGPRNSVCRCLHRAVFTNVHQKIATTESISVLFTIAKKKTRNNLNLHQ